MNTERKINQWIMSALAEVRAGQSYGDPVAWSRKKRKPLTAKMRKWNRRIAVVAALRDCLGGAA